MHELSIARSMIDIALESVKTKNVIKINRIVVVVGKLSGIVPESMKFCFDIIKSGTITENANLIIEEVPAIGYCRNCDVDINVGQYDYFCSTCSNRLEVRGGNELYLKELEAE